MKMRNVLLSSLATLTLLNGAHALAAEVDSFTFRMMPLEDSLETINDRTNDYLQKGLEILNEKGEGCDEKKLYKQLRKYYSNQYRGDLGAEIVNTQGIDAHWITIEESIYQDFNWYQSPIQGLWGRVATDPTAALIKVNGVLLGTDKFEHFMGSGYNYFKTYYLKGKPLSSALAIGDNAETGMMGSIMTGVMSYGDLVANFNGMRFWNHMLLKNDDVLGAKYNAGPYVACEDDKWVQVEKINWATYIDEAFDEGQNCSSFKTEEMRSMVETRIDLASLRYGRELKCPMNPEKILPLKEKYGEIGDEILNLEGHGIVNE